MPKYTKKRAIIEDKMLAKAFLLKGSGAAVARARGTTRQNENKKLSRKPVQDIIQKELASSEFRKRWLKEFETGAFAAERSISAVILVQKDGTVVKADDEGGIMIPDRSVRHKYLHDLAIAMGVLKLNGNGDQRVQVFVGSEMIQKLKEMETGQIKSHTRAD